MTTQTLLRIDASARVDGSTSRILADDVTKRLAPARTITRDLSRALPQIDAAWIDANTTPATDRTGDQKMTLALSDTLVAELQEADTLVISTPIYNFGVPAALKAWIDLVARAGVTFTYSANGPKGLLDGKRAIIIVTSGGTEVDGPMDFATGHLRHVLGFIGIHDVQVIAADRMAIDPDAALKGAQAQVETLAA
jgi:FMN-dependent NADH-azoreductase